MSTVNVSVEVGTVMKANINRPGWCVNTYTDQDFRRPVVQTVRLSPIITFYDRWQ